MTWSAPGPGEVDGGAAEGGCSGDDGDGETWEEKEQRLDDVAELLALALEALPGEAEAEAASETLVSRQVEVLPAASVADGKVVGLGFIDVMGEHAKANARVEVGPWAGGAWKRIMSTHATHDGHEKPGARSHGAGAVGRLLRGIDVPGPGHYGDPAAALLSRQARLTSYVGPVSPPALLAADPRKPSSTGRIPRGFSFGAPKTGHMTGVDTDMKGMGKGKATLNARLYMGNGLTVGKPPAVSTSSTAWNAPMGPPPPAPHEAQAHPAGKGSGQVVWGPHSRTPGTSYLPPVDNTPGPQAYDQEPRGLREPPLSIAFPGAARWASAPAHAASDLGPAAYNLGDLPAHLGGAMGAAGYSFGFGARFGGDDAEAQADAPGPASYHPHGNLFAAKGSLLTCFALAPREQAALLHWPSETKDVRRGACPEQPPSRPTPPWDVSSAGRGAVDAGTTRRRRRTFNATRQVAGVNSNCAQ